MSTRVLIFEADTVFPNGLSFGPSLKRGEAKNAVFVAHLMARQEPMGSTLRGARSPRWKNHDWMEHLAAQWQVRLHPGARHLMPDHLWVHRVEGTEDQVWRALEKVGCERVAVESLDTPVELGGVRFDTTAYVLEIMAGGGGCGSYTRHLLANDAATFVEELSAEMPLYQVFFGVDCEMWRFATVVDGVFQEEMDLRDFVRVDGRPLYEVVNTDEPVFEDGPIVKVTIEGLDLPTLPALSSNLRYFLAGIVEEWDDTPNEGLVLAPGWNDD